MKYLVPLAILAVPALAVAQTPNSYPMLMSVRPVAVQAGQASEHEVSARYNLYGATRVIVSGAGVTGEVVPAETKPADKAPAAKPNIPKIKLRFTAAADAVPGVRDFRIVTPQGVSTLGQIVVVRDPVVSEAADNNTPEKAQTIPIPCTVCGAIEAAEDVDCFRFHADAGTALTFHVRAQRLEDRIHDLQEHADPILTLRSAGGGTLATSDNYYAADPLLFYKFDQAGDYLLEIRDVRYKGNADWVYSIEINNRPLITQTYPSSVVPGSETKLALVGFNLPADPSLSVTLPADTAPGLHAVSPLVGGQPANAFLLWAHRLPVVLKSAPAAAAATAARMPAETLAAAGPAQAVAVPAVVNGRIDAEGEIDHYTFDAKQGERFSFEVIARRAGSALDSNLRILNAQGGVLAESDDTQIDRITQADSWLENWTAPADGTYSIEVRDLHLRGGAQFTYVLAITRSEPYFALEMDTDKTLLAPGISAPLYVRATRKNGFAGDIQLGVEGLPPGVTATCGRIVANRSDGCIILRAAADAAQAASNIRVSGNALPAQSGATAAAPATAPRAAVARPLQELYMPGGGRGHFPVEMHTVSVAEPMDIRSVKLSTAAVTLKPGESQRVEVEVERAPGMKQNVTLDVLYQHLEQPYGNSLPQGVSVDVANSKTLLTAEETKGFITLKAAADAPAVEKQLVPVMAHVSVNFVMKMTYCEPLSISVPGK